MGIFGLHRTIAGIMVAQFLFGSLVSPANAGVTASVSSTRRAEDMARALPKKLEHPYLFFTEKDKAAIHDRIENDPESRDIMARLLAEANRWLYSPVEKEFPPQCRDNRYDNDGRYDTLFYTSIEAAYTLAFIYQMTGDERYAKKAFAFADAVCDLPTWVDRALQFPKAYNRVSPWNVTDDKVIFHYGIWSAFVSYHLAPVYDWLYPALTKRERDRIRGALLEKTILRVRGNWDYHWWSTAYRCNWCSSSCGGLGLAVLAILTENPELVDVLAESYNRILRTFDEIGEDGGWQEGIGYSQANQHIAVLFGDTLKRLTGGKYNLMRHPKIGALSVNFYLNSLLPPDNTINFGDSGFALDTRQTFVFNRLAEETGSGEAVWYRNLLGEGTGINDLIWPRSSVKPVKPEPKSIHFRTIDWTVMRSDYTNPDNVVIACKSGRNDDPHHGHLDIGSFILQWRGQAFIRDLGSGPYDEPYFDEVRWQYPAASSAGHNVVFVNGEQQVPGKLYHQPMNENIGGKVIAFRTGPQRDYTLMESAQAYPMNEMKSWRRHVVLDKPDVTVLLDEVSSRKGAEIEVRFFSSGTQIPRNGYLMIEGERGTMALIPFVDGSLFTFRPGTLKSLPVKKSARLEEIPYVGVVIDADESTTDIFTIIVPVVDEHEAEKIVRSLSTSVSSTMNMVRTRASRKNTVALQFEKGGSVHQYRFTKEEGAEGRILSVSSTRRRRMTGSIEYKELI